MTRSITALDFQTDGVTAVRFFSGLRKNRVDRLIHVPLQPGEDVDSGWQNALGSISGRLKLSSEACIAALPAHWASYRNVRLPFRDRRKIKEVLHFELETTLPYTVEEMILDFRPLALPCPNGGGGILAAAVEKARQAPFLSMLESFGAKPKIVTAGAYPQAQLLAENPAFPENFLFLDMTRDNCSMYLVLGREICMIRSFVTSGNPLERVQSVKMGLGRFFAAMGEIFDGIDPPELLLLGGLAAEWPELENEFRKLLGISVQRVNLSTLSGRVAFEDGKIRYEAGRMDRALGMALAGSQGLVPIGFARDTHLDRQWWVDHRSRVFTSVAFGLLALSVFGVNFGLDLRQRQKQVDRLDRGIRRTYLAAFPDAARIVDPLKQMKINVRELEENMRTAGWSAVRHRSVDILYDFSAYIPESIDVSLAKLDIGSETVLVSGDADSFNTVDDIKGYLEKIPYFEDIRINSTSKDKTGRRVKFDLKIRLSDT